VRVAEHTITLDQSPVFYRSAPAADPPPLFLHGIPTSSDDWSELLEHTGGFAPDLIGFGRSGKGGQLDYSLSGLSAFVIELLDELEVDRVKLVGHDWGAAVGLTLAEQCPERVERIVLCNPFPPVPTVHWHRLARVWRRPAVGELAMGSTTKALFARALRRASANPETWTKPSIDALWEQFDQGTQRAILRLHRATDTPLLVSTTAALGRVSQPTLIVVGERDPWRDARDSDELAARLPSAQVIRFPEAGHWPWRDDAAAAGAIADFLR
jgi:pimeloyl-ACP methyl ester carboxylesterase